VVCSASSAVTYTSFYTDSKPRRVFWGADEELSDRGSPRVIVYGYDGIPMQPVAPPSPDHIPNHEEPQTPPVPQDKDEREPMLIQPHDPDYVPEPIFPEYIPLEDEYVLPVEEQPLPPVDSPTAESPGYVAESDLEEDPEEYEDDETDDADDEDEDEEEEEEEEEHLAPADFTVFIPTIELVSPPVGTEPVIPPPSIDTTTTGARITVRLQAAISLPPEAATLWMVSTQALIDVVTFALPSPPPPPLPPPLYIPPLVDRRDDILETEMPPRKRSCLFALGYRYEIGESSTTRLTREDAQDSRTRISQRVTMDSQWVDLLMEDRISHQETILIVEEEAYVAREAWAHSIRLSQAAYFELQTHCKKCICTRVLAPGTSNTATVAGYPYSDKTPAVVCFASSAVTYTSFYTDSKPRRVFWGADEELSDRGSPRVIVYGYDGIPMQPVAPPSPDHIPSHEEPQTPPVPQDEDEREPLLIQPHDPDYVPKPIFPEYIPLKDEYVLPVEEQPLPPVDSPTAESPGFVAESDLKEDPEEYEDDETDDADDEDEDEEEEEEEHLAPADFTVFIPTIELVSPPVGTEPIIPPPSIDTTTTGARITVRLQATISLPPEADVERLLAMPTPLPSPLTSLSPPSTLWMVSTQALIDVVTFALPLPPPPPLPLPLYIPALVDRRDDILETEMPPRKRSCLFALGCRIKEVGYGIRDTWDLYALLEDAQDSRTHISQRVTMDSQWVGLLMEDRISHQETILIVEEEAYAAREAWAHSIRLSQAAYFKLQTHCKKVYAHEFQLQAHQTRLQLQGTLIQTKHQVHETRFQMQQAEIAEL
nr:hypothetical protein [Tanacetum cinerariifolium]